MMSAPAVLFVCVSNRGKSVMAQTLMRHRHGDQITATSAGTHAAVGDAVNDLSAEVLAEAGVAVTGHTPTQANPEVLRAADLVVVVGTAELDAPPGVAVEVWETEEPSHRGVEGIERMRLIRDEITARVDDLAARLGSP